MIASLRRALLLAMPLLLWSGCQGVDGSAATAPELSHGAPSLSTSTSGPDLSRLATFNKSPTITIAWAKKWIGPAGGRLEFHGFAIDVPAGAVGQVTQFSIRLPVDPTAAERVLAEFGPHGASFAKPVTIEFPYANTSIYGSATPTVVWWNLNAKVWEPQSTRVTADGARLAAPTDHFSDFGTTDERGGTVVPSGG